MEAASIIKREVETTLGKEQPKRNFGILTAYQLLSYNCRPKEKIAIYENCPHS
jgi:hypothetical protein